MALPGPTPVSEDYFAMAVAFQAHERTVIRRYRRWEAERLQKIADDYGMRALDATGDVVERAWLEGVSEGLRTAVADIDVPDEVSLEA